MIKNSELLTIGFCGQVSAGKSSLINALCVSLNAVSTSILRETFRPELIHLMVNVSDGNIGSLEQETLKIRDLNEKARDSNNIKANAELLDRGSLWSVLGRDIDIIDFPGINDAYDKNGEFFNILKQHLNKLNILIYVTQAENCFILNSELEQYNKIKTLVTDLNNVGHYIKLITIVNKYDNPNDVDLNKVFHKIPAEITPIYPISSHKLLLSNLKQFKAVKRIPESLKSEFNKMLLTAQVVLKDELILDIDNNKPIKFSGLEFNNYLKSNKDFNLKIVQNNGDWFNFVDVIKTYNYITELKNSKYNYIYALIKSSSDIILIFKIFEELYQLLEKITIEELVKFMELLVALYKWNKDYFYTIMSLLTKRDQIKFLTYITETPKNILEQDTTLLLFYGNLLPNNFKYLLPILQLESTWDLRTNSYYDYKLKKTIEINKEKLIINNYKVSLYLSSLIQENPYLKPLIEVAVTTYHELVYHKVNQLTDFKQIFKNYPELYKNFKFRLHDPILFNYGKNVIPQTRIYSNYMDTMVTNLPKDLNHSRLFNKLFI